MKSEGSQLKMLENFNMDLCQVRVYGIKVRDCTALVKNINIYALIKHCHYINEVK